MAKRKPAGGAKTASKTKKDKKKGVSQETALRNIERDLVLGPSGPFANFSNFSRYAESRYELSAEEEREIALASRDNFNEKGPEAFNDKPARALFLCSLRYVSRLAHKYRGYGIPEMELVQEGMIGLMEAIKRYDPDKKGKSSKTKDGKPKPSENARLATYATFWIKARMNEHVIKLFSGYGKIATTEAHRKLFFKLRSETLRLGRRLNIEDAEEIAAKYDVKLADVLEMEKRFLPKIPYEKQDDGDSDEYDTSPSATLTIDEGDHAETIIERESMKDRRIKLFAEACTTLEEREARVVKARHLAEEGEKSTLKELAEEFGVSIERVRQIEKEALRKLKDYVEEHADPEDFGY